jgi:site-specific DNA recombinase
MRAVIYARVSTAKQEREGYSLPEQIDLCRKHCIEHGYVVIGEPFTDDSTGMDDDRLGLNALREVVRTLRIEVVVVTELDRLARKRVLHDLIEEELRDLGARVDYVIEHFDESDEGDLFKDIKKSVAEYDRKKILRRLKSGKIGRAKSGRVLLGKYAPYGYRKTDDGSLEIFEEEAQVVQLIFRWYVQGDGDGRPLQVRTICERLATEGYLKPQFHIKQRYLEAWSPSTIRKILASEVYIGVWYFNKTKQLRVKNEMGKTVFRTIARPREEWIAVPAPAIIEPDLFEAARLTSKHNTKHAPRNRRHFYVFAGMLRCEGCRRAYSGAKAKQGRARYVCGGTQRDPVKTCSQPDFYEADMLDVIWPWFANLLKNPQDVLDAINARNASQEEALRPLRERLVRIDRQIADAQQRVVNLRDRLETENDPEEREDIKLRLARHKAARDDLEKERATTEGQLNHRSYKTQQSESLFEVCQRWAGKLDNATPEQKRELLLLFRFEARLAIEERMQVVYCECVLGAERIPVDAKTLTGGRAR